MEFVGETEKALLFRRTLSSLFLSTDWRILNTTPQWYSMDEQYRIKICIQKE